LTCPSVHQRALRVELLRGDGILFYQTFVSLEIQTRVLEQRLIAAQVALRGLQRSFIGPGIYLSDQVALMNQLPLGKGDFLQGAADLGSYRDVGQRGDRAQRGNSNLDIARRHRSHRHGHRSVLAAASTAARARAIVGRLWTVLDDRHHDHQEQQKYRDDDQCSPVFLDEGPRAAGRCGHTIFAIVYHMYTWLESGDNPLS